MLDPLVGRSLIVIIMSIIKERELRENETRAHFQAFFRAMRPLDYV